MKFVVDESSVSQVEAQHAEKALGSLTRLMSLLKENDFRVLMPEAIYSANIGDDILGAWLYARHSDIDYEQRDFIQQELDQTIRFSGDEIGSAVTAFRVEGERDGKRLSRDANSHGLAYAAFMTRDEREAVGCLACDGPHQKVLVSSRLGEDTADAFIIIDENDLKVFFRYVPEVELHDSDAYIKNARYAFPDLYFVEGLANQSRRFKTPWDDIRPVLTQHLSALNDDFQRIFHEESGQPDLILKRIASLHGFDSSPASPKVRRNKAAMRERDVEIDGRVLRCEWHTKFHPTHDRIYFHPG